MSSRKGRECGPGLSAWWNVLPLFFANYALPRRDTARRVLGAAGSANERFHITVPGTRAFMHVDYRPSPAGFARIYQTENEKWGRLAKRVQPEGKRLMNTKSKITIAVLAGVCGQDHLTDESSFLEFELERNK